MNGWYHKDAKEVFELLKTSPEGLSAEEARERLSVYGLNELTEKKRMSPIVRFLLQFHNLLIYVLLGASAITALMREWVDSGVIFGVVVINAIIGFIQESKAEQALASLKRMLSLRATVIRGGRKMEIPAERLVPGDVVVLGSGDRVPADMRLFKVKNLHVDEAALTGESLPVGKVTEPVRREAEIGDRVNMAFSGTFVTSGQGVGLVTATGDDTEIGKIAEMLQEVEEVKTPLTKKIASFSKVLTVVIIAGCAAFFAFGTLIKGQPSVDMFMAAIALAISAIPEGLPAIMTITLAIGVTRMAKRHAIIRKLPAVETLGSTTVICTDKTGTLTRNEMTVTRIITPEGDFSVTGVGYAPSGSFVKDGDGINASEHLSLVDLLRAGLLCNDALLRHDGAEWRIAGDPTEGAIIVAARKALLEQDNEKALMPRTDFIPFESEQQFMATLHHDHYGNGVVYLKGAPERVISLCASAWGKTDDGIDVLFWEDRARDMASGGLRILAIASKRAPKDQLVLSFKDIEEDGFTLLGLVGMIDPLRQEAMEGIAACKGAGIGVKMITGDHALTAKAIATEMGLGGTVMTGVELDRLEDEEFDKAASGVNVFARVNPGHKLRLVRSLQKQGEVVAMTGDGVNDAPALKQADIGIAMGITGTEVSKEAADMVIADDNFASIERAVEEGRTVFNNLKKTIMFILPTNGGECLVIIWAIATGALLPVLPLHILWINMITTVALAITLAFEPIEAGTMKAPPRIPDAPLLEPYLIWRIILVSVVMAAGCFGLFYYERMQGASLEAARTVAVNVIVFFEIFYVFNTRYLTGSVLSLKGLFGNRIILAGAAAVVLLQIMFTYWPPLNHLFKTEPIGMWSWFRIVAASASILFIVEAEKAVLNKGFRRFIK
jgi:magnesium-transporting ATPase (P-type)